jgi:glycosyltransferase involved in cell wall biosynthesis
MLRFCRKELMNFDVIHVDGYRSIPGALVCHYGSKYGIPVVMQPRGAMPVVVSSFAVKRAFDLLLGPRMLRQCAFLIASSEQEELGFHGIVPPGKRVVRIHDGIDLGEFKDLPEKGSFRRRYGITEPYLITYLGRLHQQKGIDVLIRAAATTRCRGQSRLAIIGPDDGFKPRLVALARELGLQDSVSFVAPVAGREKLEAYVDSDVVVYAGQSESFGLVPFEATMCGVPSISSEEAACAEILGALGIGFRVPYGDPRKLAATIDTILETRAEVIPRVQAAAMKLRETLSWEEIARQYEDAYLTAASAKVPGLGASAGRLAG